MRPQLKKLKRVVEYAFENKYCDFYRTLYKDRGMAPEKIKSLSDFKKLPAVSKEDVIKYGDGFRFADFADIKTCVHTSGTTNNRQIIFLSKNDLRARRKTPTGYQFDRKKRRHMCLAPPNPSLPTRRNAGVEGDIYNLGVSADIAKTMRINTLRTSPTLAIIFGKMLKKIGYATTQIELLLLDGEAITPLKKKEIEKTYSRARIFCDYGLKESGKIGYQCTNLAGQNTYHMHPKSHFFEVLNPETGEDCKEGETGELAVTNLWLPTACAFVRYGTGDLVKLIEEKSTCPCGATGMVISIIGRANIDRIRLHGITLYKHNFDSVLGEIGGFIKGGEYQIHIYEEMRHGNILEKIEIHAVPHEGIKDPERTKRSLEDRIMANFKISSEHTWKDAVERNIFLPIELKFVDAIERKGWKQIGVVDHRVK